MGIATLASIVFSTLTSLNLSRSRHWKCDTANLEPHQRIYRDLGTSLVWKYWLLSSIGVIETTLGFLWSLHPWFEGPFRAGESRPWYTIFEPGNNILQLPLVYYTNRGIQLFLLFGLGSGARQKYYSWLWALYESLAVPKVYRWLGRQVRRVQWRRGWAAGPSPENFTPFRPDDIAMEPYIIAMPSRDEGHSSSHKLTPPRPIPISAPRSSKRSQMDHNEALPAGPSERWRSFHKDRIELPPPSLPNEGRAMRKQPLPPSLVPMARQ